jgi:hypothetical protein
VFVVVDLDVSRDASSAPHSNRHASSLGVPSRSPADA